MIGSPEGLGAPSRIWNKRSLIAWQFLVLRSTTYGRTNWMNSMTNDETMDEGGSVITEETRKGKFQVQVRSGASTFLVDEPVHVGGLGSGPNPYDLLASALGACTVMTVRLYADHKGWPLEHVCAKVTHSRPNLAAPDVFKKEVLLRGALDEAQRARLLEVAGRCPVHRSLERGAEIHTNLVSRPLREETTAPSDQHNRDSEGAAQS
jgi:putative redox protein